MSDIFFFIKIIILTSIFTILMQIKIGETTLEQKTEVMIKESYFGQTMVEVAQGAIHALRDVYKSLLDNVDSKVTKELDQKNIPGHRSFGVELKRSKEFLSEQLKRGKEVAEEKAKAAIKEVKENPDIVQEKAQAVKSKATEIYESLEE